MPGPEDTLTNYEKHMKMRGHRERVAARVGGGARRHPGAPHTTPRGEAGASPDPPARRNVVESGTDSHAAAGAESTAWDESSAQETLGLSDS